MNTGIVRELDQLGRVVLPKELRRTMNLQQGDGLAISLEGDKIILSKHQLQCALCDSTENLRPLENGRVICQKCISAIRIGDINV